MTYSQAVLMEDVKRLTEKGKYLEQRIIELEAIVDRMQSKVMMLEREDYDMDDCSNCGRPWHRCICKLPTYEWEEPAPKQRF